MVQSDIPARGARGCLSLSRWDLYSQYPPPVTEHTEGQHWHSTLCVFNQSDMVPAVFTLIPLIKHSLTHFSSSFYVLKKHCYGLQVFIKSHLHFRLYIIS